MNMKEYFKKYTKQSKKGFTLVELIAVIVILSVISTATVSVFLAIQTTVKDTGDITTQQFSTTQLERFIRNEFQTASKVDIYGLEVSENKIVPESTFTPKKNDEYIFYNDQTQQMIFMRYSNDTGSSSAALIIDEVEDVVFDICPLDTTATNTKGMSYKLIYKITTNSYTYSGGIVLGNSHDGDADTFVSAKTFLNGNAAAAKKNAATLHWCAEPDESDPEYVFDNTYCITFHSLNSQKTTGATSSATTSTP